MSSKSKALEIKNKRMRISASFARIGTVFLILGPVVFIVVPALFAQQLCAGTGCGYAGAGLAGYALYIAAEPFILGIVLLIIAFFVKPR